jgi:uncharacterized membrane protein
LLEKHERLRRILKAGAVVAICVGAIIAVVMVTGLGDVLQERYVVSLLESQTEGVSYVQSASSGRDVIWLDTLSKMTNLNHIYQWFFGYGIGHFGSMNVHGLYETDMGSQYIHFFYEYGLFVGLALCALMFKAYSLVQWRSSHPWAKPVKVMFVIFLASSFVEGFVYTTQVGWLIGVGAAIVLQVLRHDRVALPWSRNRGYGIAINGGPAMKSWGADGERPPVGMA